MTRIPKEQAPSRLQSPPISAAATTVEFLLSERGRIAAAGLEEVELGEECTLTLLTQLRRHYSPEEAGAVLTLARLRRRARVKFPQAASLFFVPDALEQATAWPIACHRAGYIDRHAPAGAVLDLGCGIGADTLALAHLRPVIAYERDPIRLAYAQANAAALGLSHRVTFVQADWTETLDAGQVPSAAAAFADPSRRLNGRRVYGLQRMQPPLARLIQLQQRVPCLGVKVAPSVEDKEIPAGCSTEFISHDGICKEAVLWFGPLAGTSAQPGRRWASVHKENRWHRLFAGGGPPPVGDLRPDLLLHEPDGAVIRAGALAELCLSLQAHLFDPQIAYLVSPPGRSHPLTQAFRLLEVHPFGLKLLNRRLQALDVGRVELKKRGFPSDPESLRGRLRLAQSDRSAVLFLTRRGDNHIMLIAERVAHDPPEREKATAHD